MTFSSNPYDKLHNGDRVKCLVEILDSKLTWSGAHQLTTSLVYHYIYIKKLKINDQFWSIVNSISCSVSFSHKLWNIILGWFNSSKINCNCTKKGREEQLPIQNPITPIGNFLKNLKYSHIQIFLSPSSYYYIAHTHFRLWKNLNCFRCFNELI